MIASPTPKARRAERIEGRECDQKKSSPAASGRAQPISLNSAAKRSVERRDARAGMRASREVAVQVSLRSLACARWRAAGLAQPRGGGLRAKAHARIHCGARVSENCFFRS